MSGKRDSNPRPRPWQGRALPTELFPQYVKINISKYFIRECKFKRFFHYAKDFLFFRSNALDSFWMPWISGKNATDSLTDDATDS